MDANKIARLIVKGYKSNADLLNKLIIGGVTLIACKLLKIPVTYKSNGVSVFDSDYYESKTTPEDITFDLPWTNSPSITAIYHLLEGSKRKSFDSDRFDSAKKIYEIASESVDNSVKSYAIKALSQISQRMDFASRQASIDNYITELAVEIV